MLIIMHIFCLNQIYISYIVHTIIWKDVTMNCYTNNDNCCNIKSIYCFGPTGPRGATGPTGPAGGPTWPAGLVGATGPLGLLELVGY